MELSVCLFRLDMAVAVFAALSHLGLGAAGAWGFPLAASVFAVDNSHSIYMGIQACYFSVFGLFAFLAELRQQKLQESLLKQFPFLHSHFGRGCFALYCGSCFLFLPWDKERPWVNRLVGGAELASGVFLCVFSFFAPGAAGGGGAQENGRGVHRVGQERSGGGRGDAG